MLGGVGGLLRGKKNSSRGGGVASKRLTDTGNHGGLFPRERGYLRKKYNKEPDNQEGVKCVSYSDTFCGLEKGLILEGMYWGRKVGGSQVLIGKEKYYMGQDCVAGRGGKVASP